VAYESQLKSDRAQLHRHLVAAIEHGDENASLIAEHLEAAGDLQAAFAWHMRAGTWLTNRDIAGAYTSWRRAQQVADRLPDDDPERMSMRIAPRTLLCASAFRVGGPGLYTGFDELRDLCQATGDQRSLAIGMVGQLMAETASEHRREASRLAAEHLALLESIGDSTLTVALLVGPLVAKYEIGEMAEVLRLAQQGIDLADGDATKGNMIFASPLGLATALRGVARFCLGILGWLGDLDDAIVMARSCDAMMLSGVIWYKYAVGISYGVLLADDTALRETDETLTLAKQSGDDLAFDLARTTRGIILVHRGGSDRAVGLDLLSKVRDAALGERIMKSTLPLFETEIAREKIRSVDIDGGIDQLRAVLNGMIDSGGSVWMGLATSVLVEALVQRACGADLEEAQAAIQRLAAVPDEQAFLLHEVILLRLRALLAHAEGDDTAYRDYRDRYRDMARTLGFEGHIAWAEAMR
jgi:adenylate cyclase